MKKNRLLKSKRALSPVFSTILLIVIVVIGMTVAFGFFVNYVKDYQIGSGSSVLEAAQIEDVWFKSATTSKTFPRNPSSDFLWGGTTRSGSFNPASLASSNNQYMTYGSYASAFSTSQWDRYYPSQATPLGQTQLFQGSLGNLQSDDGNYMIFRSYPSKTSSQALYAHSETTVVGGTTYNNLALSSADTSGITLSAPMGSTGRALFGKSVYSLQGVSSIPASSWTMYYRAWRDPSANIVFDNVGSPVSATVSYVPITITNDQGSATPAPFQQMITWNPSTYTSYEASDLGNIRFYSDSAFTTPLYAWLELCTPSLSNTATSATAWVKLTSPIAGSGSLTIYMVFRSTSTGFDGNYWGYAPKLSGAYGQYDNGANVFNFYDDFKGTTLSTKWTSSVTSGTLTVNDGIKLYTATASGSAGINFAAAQSSSNIIVEAAMNVYGSSGTNIRDRVNQGLPGFNHGDYGYFSQSSGPRPQYFINGAWTGTAVPVSSSPTSYNILDQQIMTSSGGFTWYSLNYPDGTTIYSHTASFTSGSTFTGGYAATIDSGVTGTTSEVQMEFVRIRAYPSSNDMPSVSFGTIGSSNSVSWSHTTGSGSNRIMIVGVSIKSSSVQVSSIVYGSQSLTYIRRDTNSGGIRSELWYLIAPASGTATVTVNLSGYAVATGGSCTYIGVAQTSPIDNSNGGSGSSTSPSQSVTVNTANSFLIGNLAISGNAAVSSEGSGQTPRWDQSIVGANRGHGSEQGPDGTGSQSMSWGLSSSAAWAVSVVAFKPVSPPVGNVEVDLKILKSDGSVRATIATGVAASGSITTPQTTLSASYSWTTYTVIDQTDYLEIDYYVDVTSAVSGVNAYLRIDDNTLGISDQTRITNINLPSEYTFAVEFTGSSNINQWPQLTWKIDSSSTTSAGVAVTFQLFNYGSGAYPASGDGYMTDTIGTSDKTESRTITSNPTSFKDSNGNWKMKISAVKTTTSQFDWKCDLVVYEIPSPTEFTSEVEFTGSSDKLDWTGLDWTVECGWTTSGVPVTLQLYDWTAGKYPTDGDGYVSYTSAAGSDQTQYKNITANPTRFRNPTDQTWKVKIKAVSTTTQFNCNVDWIEFYPKTKENPVEIWLYNYGKIETKISTVYINSLLVDSTSPTIQIGNHTKLIAYSPNPWTPNTSYHIRIITERGTAFEGTYVSPATS